MKKDTYIYIGKYDNDDIIKIGETTILPSRREYGINKENKFYKGTYKHIAYVKIANNDDTTLSRYLETSVQHKFNRLKDYMHMDGQNKDHFITYANKDRIVKDFINIIEPLLKEEGLEYHITIKG